MLESTKVTHLGFIQAVIARMANNCFLIKGWTVTLVVAVLVLSLQESRSDALIIAILPVWALGWLDAYYFYQERLYRQLYDLVACGEVESKNLSLDVSALRSIKLGVNSAIRPCISLFYLSLFFLLTLVIYYLDH